MTRGEVAGEWSRVGTFHYVSFVKPVGLAAGIISGSLPFFSLDICCPFPCPIPPFWEGRKDGLGCLLVLRGKLSAASELA